VERTEPVPAARRPGEGSLIADHHGARRRRLSGAQRQRSILYAAAEVFARRGYDGARIEEIADQANVSKALIYEHFKGKRDLYAHIRGKGTADSLQRTLEAVAAAENGESKTLLEAGLNAFFEFLAEQPLVWRVIQQEVSDPEIAALTESDLQRSEHAIAALLAADDLIAGQDLGSDQIELIAAMMHGATDRAARWWLDNPSADRDKVADALMQLMWLGLDQIRVGATLAD
jgi:AcrR family transcriptional regulator